MKSAQVKKRRTGRCRQVKCSGVGLAQVGLQGEAMLEEALSGCGRHWTPQLHVARVPCMASLSPWRGGEGDPASLYSQTGKWDGASTCMHKRCSGRSTLHPPVISSPSPPVRFDALRDDGLAALTASCQVWLLAATTR
ncbi:hypothetical protein L1887_59300 [Cichorium endivia]|nr:hypothetical protein L1887_59300 [Cichorium endivia]